MLPNIWKYVSGILGIALLGLMIYTGFLSASRSLAVSQRDKAVNEKAAFVAQTKAAAADAAAAKAKTESKYEDDLRAARAAADAWRVRARNAGASGSFVSGATGNPRGTGGQGKICFEPADFDRAMELGRGIAARGDQAVADTIELTAGWPRE